MSTSDAETLITSEGLEGFKTLNLSQNTPTLVSAFNFVWKPRTYVTAVCTKCERPVQADCSCGIYAAKTFEHLKKIHYAYDQIPCGGAEIVVKLSLWGRVQVCKTGYRAEKAKIVEIRYRVGVSSDETTLPPSELFERHTQRAFELEEAYGVPVTLEAVRQPSASTKLASTKLASTKPYTAPLTYDELVEAWALRAHLNESERKFVESELRKRSKQKIAKLTKNIEAFYEAIDRARSKRALFERNLERMDKET